jgi:hypothetical protein
MLTRVVKTVASAACGFVWISSAVSAQQISSLPQTGASITEARTTCAVRDIALITMLEDRGPVAPSELLFRTFWDMIKAREACQEGRSAEALKMYDTALMKLKGD